MTSKDLKVSLKMAVMLGLFLPIAETVRRINQIFDYREFFSWFDDYILGAILLWSAYLVFKERKNSVAYLIATWGIAAGALFLSFSDSLSITKQVRMTLEYSPLLLLQL